MFVVASVFRNEAPLLREWLEHYLAEGAVHFFLVDHLSTDDPFDRVRDYADRITWFRSDRPFEPGVQTALLNEHVLPLVRGGKCWVLVCDVDEYLYAPSPSTVADVLLRMPPHVNRVWTPWKVFGSDGHAAQPPSVVRGFTRRADGVSLPFRRVPGGYESHLGVGKTVARHVAKLDVHESTTSADNATLYAWDKAHTPAHLVFRLPANPLLELNHYMFMSRDYYEKVKCVRGGGQTGPGNPKYSMRYYDEAEPACNAVRDMTLFLKRG